MNRDSKKPALNRERVNFYAELYGVSPFSATPPTAM